MRTILLGALVLFVHGRLGLVVDHIATACYIAVALLFYDIFKPVNRSLSLLGAFFSLVGLATGKLNLHPEGVDIGFGFFGFHCLLIGHLIFRLTFLPRILGVLMAIAGLGWLTFLLPPLADSLSPYDVAPPASSGEDC